MSQIMKCKTLIGSALSVTLMAALLAPTAMASEKSHADHQKGQAAESQQMDHSQMKSMDHDGMDHSKMKGHGSIKHDRHTDKAKAGGDHHH